MEILDGINELEQRKMAKSHVIAAIRRLLIIESDGPPFLLIDNKYIKMLKDEDSVGSFVLEYHTAGLEDVVTISGNEYWIQLLFHGDLIEFVYAKPRFPVQASRQTIAVGKIMAIKRKGDQGVRYCLYQFKPSH